MDALPAVRGSTSGWWLHVSELHQLLHAMLDEQRRTNELLSLLVQALADDQDEDAPRTHDLAGRPL